MPLKHNYHWQQHGLLKCIIQPLLLSRKSAAKAYRYSIITVSISYWRVEKKNKFSLFAHLMLGVSFEQSKTMFVLKHAI